MSLTTGCRNADEALAYVDKSIDNVADLDVIWETREVVEMLEDIRSLLVLGSITPGTFTPDAEVGGHRG